MSDVGDGWNEAMEEVAAAAPDFMADTMTIKGQGSVTEDEWGNTSTGAGADIPGIPCEVEDLTAFEKMTVAQVRAATTHKIKTVVVASTLAIQPKQQLVVAASGLIPARTFDVSGPPKLIRPYLFIDVTRR